MSFYTFTVVTPPPLGIRLVDSWYVKDSKSKKISAHFGVICCGGDGLDASAAPFWDEDDHLLQGSDPGSSMPYEYGRSNMCVSAAIRSGVLQVGDEVVSVVTTPLGALRVRAASPASAAAAAAAQQHPPATPATEYGPGCRRHDLLLPNGRATSADMMNRAKMLLGNLDNYPVHIKVRRPA